MTKKSLKQQMKLSINGQEKQTGCRSDSFLFATSGSIVLKPIGKNFQDFQWQRSFRSRLTFDRNVFFRRSLWLKGKKRVFVRIQRDKSFDVQRKFNRRRLFST